MASQQTIGLIGVGLLGTAIAERLLAANYEVLGFDLEPKQLEHLAQLQGSTANSAEPIFEQCQTVIWSLPKSSDSLKVSEQLIAGPSRPTKIVDTTTGDPDEIIAIADLLGQANIGYLDATVAGSSQDVRDGVAVVMVGGKRKQFDQAQPLLNAIAPKTYYLGNSGSGSKMKLVVNLVLGLERAVLAEGLAFAERLGIDLQQALEVLKAGPAAARPMETKGEKMINGNYEPPQARLDQHKKDVEIILELGSKLDAHLPLSKLHHNLLQEASKLGFGLQDNSSIMELFRAMGPGGRSSR